MKIGIIQLRSVLDPQENLKTLHHYLGKAREEGVEAVFLPECFYSLSDGLSPTPYLVEGQNQHYQNIQNLSREYKIHLLGGSAATQIEGKNGKAIVNRAYNFGPDGTLLSHYDKIHLFSIDLSKAHHHHVKDKDGKEITSARVMDEGKIYTSGKEEKIQDLGPFKIGMSICFDLRFPELFRHYSAKGANVLSISSAFTVPTGRAHWHTLLRARAIENQSYVIAAAQWGKHNDRISTFGHSLIVDPWGTVLADAEEGEKMITATLDLTLLENVRGRMKVF